MGDSREEWVPDAEVDLWRALDTIPAHHRAALLMNVIDGYSQAEIAVMIGAPPGTVAGWIAGAKSALRGQLNVERS
jgi:DNA-directed RNA polymerase specialized sigma24 family protein